jgi:hypothetical protein
MAAAILGGATGITNAILDGEAGLAALYGVLYVDAAGDAGSGCGATRRCAGSAT